MTDQPKSLLKSYQCTHTCGCFCIQTNDGRAVFPSWDACKSHVASKLSHTKCSDACPGFPLFSSEPDKLKPSDFRRGQSDRAVPPSQAPVNQSSKTATVKTGSSTEQPVRSNPQTAERGARVERDETQGPSNEPQTNDNSDDEIELICFRAKCIHTCRCFGRALGNDPCDVFSSLIEAMSHAEKSDKHPRCTSSCPGFARLGYQQSDSMSTGTNIKMEMKEVDLFSADDAQSREEAMPDGGASPSSDDDSDSSDDSGESEAQSESELDEGGWFGTQGAVNKVYKCSHTCPCSGSAVSIPKFAAHGRAVFASDHGCRRHITCHSRHLKCTPTCPAFKFLGAATFAPVKAISIYLNKPNNTSSRQQHRDQVGQSSKRTLDEGESISSLAKKVRLELPRDTFHTNIAPPRFKYGSSTIKSVPKAQPTPPAHRNSPTPTKVSTGYLKSALKRPASQLEGESWTAPPPPKRCNTESPSTRAPQTQAPSSSATKNFLIQHINALNELCRQLSQLPSELDALSTGLQLLPHTTDSKTSATQAGSSATLSTHEFSSSLVSSLGHIANTLKAAGEALKEVLQSKYQAGFKLLETQDSELGALRRRVSKLSDQAVDLQLDLQKASQRDGMDGVMGERKRAKGVISEISKELEKVRTNMKRLMEGALGHLP